MSKSTQANGDFPNCPECETDVFVQGSKGEKPYYCNICNVEFGEDGETQFPTQNPERVNAGGSKDWRYTLEHAHLLEFLQNYDSQYFKSNHVVSNMDMSRKRFGDLVKVLHNKELVEPWGALGNRTTWMLTDKGKESKPRDLVEV
jgi:predicted transcriptional regulator